MKSHAYIHTYIRTYKQSYIATGWTSYYNPLLYYTGVRISTNYAHFVLLLLSSISFLFCIDLLMYAYLCTYIQGGAILITLSENLNFLAMYASHIWHLWTNKEAMKRLKVRSRLQWLAENPQKLGYPFTYGRCAAKLVISCQDCSKKFHRNWFSEIF